MRTRIIVPALIALFAAGCSTEGAYVDADQLKAAQESVTTAEQLEQALGSPSVTIPLSDGNILWVYEGIHTVADPTSYIPYLNLLIATNSKKCTRLTVVVDHDNGQLSDWRYVTAKDTDYWAKTSDTCGKRGFEQPANPSDDASPE